MVLSNLSLTSEPAGLLVSSQEISAGYPGLKEFGSGPQAVVFLHGLFGTPDHWSKIMLQLGDRYRLLAPQLPINHSGDRRRQGVQSIGELTNHIEQILEARGLDNFVLCGNSLGGLVAIDYALRHPNRVSGLVLAGSAGLYERSLTNGVKPKPSREFIRQVIADIFYDDSMITDDLVEEWYKSIQDRDYARFILRISRATRDRCVEEELSQLQMPTLIVWGREDVITPPEVAEQFRRRIQGAQLQYLERCGHAPNLEQPDAFASLLNQFLPQCFTAHRG
jgi:2-hydroxy-6-oxonona-2,4-dienedioate hydrolase